MLIPEDLSTDKGYVNDKGFKLWDLVLDNDCFFVAHNVMFEKRIWREIMVKQYGWPDIPDERWHDIMASCAMKAIPLKLERAASVLRLPMLKDTEGTKVTLTFSHTDKKGIYGGNPDTRAERLQRVYAYNAQDLRAELGVHRRIRGLGASERGVWLLDQVINARGIRLDMDFVSAAQTICEQAAKPLAASFASLTGLKATQTQKFKAWLEGQGVVIDNLRKETIKELLDDEAEDDQEDSLAEEGEDYGDHPASAELPEIALEALRIRSIIGSASIKKLNSMPLCCASDGRAHGLLQYHGAGPGRWAGRLLQPHNFPRPSLKVSEGFDPNGKERFAGHDPELLVSAILSRDAELVRAFFGEPIEAVASGLRHTLISEPGYSFEVGDFNTVEARIVLAIAGARNALSIIMDKERDVYCEMAAKIYGVPAPRGKAEIKYWKEAKLEWRQTGKNTVLGCGFQMGWKKFKARYAKDKPDEFAQKCITAYREDFAPEVTKLWDALGKAAISTVWDRTSHEAYGVLYQLEDGFLTARLHSGRKLWYWDPRPEMLPMPWDPMDKRPGFTYTASKGGKIIRTKGYGGLLTENVVQGLARDLLVHAMFNAESDNHPCVLTVHDELITEVLEPFADAHILEQYMTTIPTWAKELGVPVGAECWTGTRYRK